MVRYIISFFFFELISISETISFYKRVETNPSGAVCREFFPTTNTYSENMRDCPNMQRNMSVFQVLPSMCTFCMVLSGM